jgi:rRNA maturation endonuclease Nob1
LARDDWKYYDDDMEEGGEEGKKDLPPEKQCRNCLHWVPREAPSCAWCGKPFEDKDRGSS